MHSLDIDTFQRLFVNQQNDVFQKRLSTKIKPKNKLSNMYDKLFFNFLVLCNYDIGYDYNLHQENHLKLALAQKMESFSFKGKEALLQQMCYEDHIDLKILACLACYFQKNMVYYCDKVFFQYQCDDTKQVLLINKDKDIRVVTHEFISTLTQDAYEIQNIQKPLYSMSHYKVEELKQISTQMHLCLDDTCSYKKKDYYEAIDSFLKRILI